MPTKPIAFSFNTAAEVPAEEIVYPRNASEVVLAVNDARRRGLRVAAQATGHNVSAYGTLDGAMLIDVRNLQDVEIDATAMRVRAGAGVKWERIAPQLSELGLAGLHGSSPDVGIAGYSLGGGIGWLSRKYGMQTNSVTAIEIVLADGRLVRTDHVNEPELFWALRGGNGNFGVVTAIEFRVYPVAEVYAGAMFFPFERSAEVLHAWARMLPGLPEELMTWANIMHFPDAPFVPEDMRGGSYAIVMGAYLGAESEGRELLQPIRDLGPAIDTFQMASPEVLGELAMDPPEPLPIALGHHLLDDFSAEAVDAILSEVGPGSGSPLAMVQLRHMGGALARVEPHAGARATLAGDVCFLVLGVTPDEESARAVRAAIDQAEQTMLPWRAGDYPNFIEKPTDASGFFDAVTWARLQQAKATYDPSNLFRGNHRIPAAEAVKDDRLAA
jgi:FAD/FMN-containing dehydrogenase